MALAIAADIYTATTACPNPPCATLWSIVPTTANPNLQGSLYAYTIAMNNAANASPAFGTLTPLFSWDNGSPCANSTAPANNVKNWFMPTFTEPTLAENQQGSSSVGAVYVPTTCVITNGGSSNATACYGWPYVASGVLVFTNCPS